MWLRLCHEHSKVVCGFSWFLFPPPPVTSDKTWLSLPCLLLWCLFSVLLWDVRYCSQQQLGLGFWRRKASFAIFLEHKYEKVSVCGCTFYCIIDIYYRNKPFLKEIFTIEGLETLIGCFAAEFRHSRNHISVKMNFPYKGYKSSSVVVLWPVCSFIETWVTQTLKSKTESPFPSTAFLLKLGQERSLQTICSCGWCNTAQGHSVPGKQNCLWMDLDEGPPRKHRMKSSGKEIHCQLVPKTFRWTRRAP